MKRPNISDKLREKVRQTARDCCGFCLCWQIYSLSILQIDHIIPLAKGGTNDEENLWLVCETCNRAKSAKTGGFDSVTNSTALLFNPRTQNWQDHFAWGDNYTRIVGNGTSIRMNLLIQITSTNY